MTKTSNNVNNTKDGDKGDVPVSFRASIELRLAMREAAMQEATRLRQPDYRVSDFVRDAVREKLQRTFEHAA